MRGTNLWICTILALWFHAIARTGSCVNETSWVPACDGFTNHDGMGPGCYGVWTKKWKEHQGDIPGGLMSRIQNDNFRQSLLDGVCPYGIALPGSVTWPDSGRFKETVADGNHLKYVAVVYSYVPYLLAIDVALWFLYYALKLNNWCRHRPSEKHDRADLLKTIYLLAFAAFVVFVSEVLLKPFCGIPRPGAMLQLKDNAGRYVGSCVESCGFPSSHSALAMGWFFMIIKDLMVEGLAKDRKTALKESAWLLIIPFRSSTEKGCVDTLSFYLLLSWWAFWLLPVAFMRVVLYDHSIAQVFWGGCLGLLLAFLWYNIWKLCGCNPSHAGASPSIDAENTPGAGQISLVSSGQTTH